MNWVIQYAPNQSKQDLVAQKVGEYIGNGIPFKHVEHQIVGNRLWMILVEVETGLFSPLVIDLFECGAGWGFKHSINYNNMPQSVSKKVTATDDSSIDWFNEPEDEEMACI